MDTHDTIHAAVASYSAKSMLGGAAMSVAGWFTQTDFVSLVGLFVTLAGLGVTVIFKYIDTKNKQEQSLKEIARIDAEEKRAEELHQLQVQEIKIRIEKDKTQ
jgi:hypothetical protein